MNNNKKTDTIRVDKDSFRFNVDIYIFKERENYISYCPSLDICSSGVDFNDALKNFYEAFELYAAIRVIHPDIPCRLVIYHGANHGLLHAGAVPLAVMQRLDNLRWFERYLFPADQVSAADDVFNGKTEGVKDGDLLR